MARIAGVDLPNDKRIEIALTYIYGIGRTTARKILDTTGVSGDIRVKNLTDEETGKLRTIIERELQGRGCAAQRDGDEHQAPDGHRRATAACAIAAACRCAGSAPRPTRAPARVRRRPPAR